MLFGGRKQIDLEAELSTVQELILYLKDNELSERAELFIDGESLYFLGELIGFISRRSGILVLINDIDWEVMEKEKTELTVSCPSSYSFFTFFSFVLSFPVLFIHRLLTTCRMVTRYCSYLHCMEVGLFVLTKRKIYIPWWEIISLS